jgi:hypothetical protein
MSALCFRRFDLMFFQEFKPLFRIEPDRDSGITLIRSIGCFMALNPVRHILSLLSIHLIICSGNAH